MNQSEIAGLLKAFSSLKSSASSLNNQLENLEGELNIVEMNAKYDWIGDIYQLSLEDNNRISHVKREILMKAEQTRGLLDTYNTYATHFEKLTKINLDHIESLETMLSTQVAYTTLTRIINESDRAIGSLENMLSPISPQDRTKLDELKTEVKSLGEGMRDKRYTALLDKAIGEAEANHSLAASLLAAKVGDAAITKVIKILPKKSDNTIDDEELIQLLEGGGIRTPSEDRGTTKTQIIKAIKKTRDFTMHDLDADPDVGEAYGLIADAKYILKLLKDKL
jgi:hypothetical protein